MQWEQETDTRNGHRNFDTETGWHRNEKQERKHMEYGGSSPIKPQAMCETS